VSNKKRKKTMQINLSGHHVEITEAIKSHIKAKLNKIAGHYPSLISMTVILGHERNSHTAEINTSYEGVQISATGSEENLYAAIASTCKKIDAALSHRKGALKANQHNKPVLAEAEEAGDDEEPEYEHNMQDEYEEPQDIAAAS
jgi:putative sigma-54 modulation protein